MTEKQKYYIKNRLMSEFIDLANTCKYLDDFGEFHEGYSFGTKVTFRLGELFQIINKALDESDEKLISELFEEGSVVPKQTD